MPTRPINRSCRIGATAARWRSPCSRTCFIPTSADIPYDYNTDLTYFGVEFDPQYTDRLMIRRVLPNSRAYLAGLRDGDEITTWHGERIRSPRDFARAIHDVKPGVVDFEYNRGSRAIRGQATFDRREDRTSLKPVLPQDNNRAQARQDVNRVATRFRSWLRLRVARLINDAADRPRATRPARQQVVSRLLRRRQQDVAATSDSASRTRAAESDSSSRTRTGSDDSAGNPRAAAHPAARANPPRPTEPPGTAPREK